MDMYAEAAMVRIKQARRESVKHINHYLQPLGLDLPSSHPVCYLSSSFLHLYLIV